MTTPLWQRLSTPTKARNPDSNGSRHGKGLDMVTPVSGRVSQIQFDDPRILPEKISELEKELFEYQHSMGLLLIEKKEWSSEYEKLQQDFEEANECLKRERNAHMVAIADVEKREEGLRKALGIEKQCSHDLEKALRELLSENAEIKFTADSKLTEANALVRSVEEKSLEVEAKLRAVDARLAEVSRKSSEVERKAKEMEARESSLQRERFSYIAEREADEAALSKQREDLREWERKLQEGEERVAKSQMIVKQREDRANENDKIIKQKGKELEEAQKKIDAANLAVKKLEDDISLRIKDLALREQETDVLKKSLETKARELQALQEKLEAREKMAVQQLIDEHQAKLDATQREFELEMEQKRKSVDDSLKSKVAEVEKREAEWKHMEEKVVKREQALDRKLEKHKEKEKEFDLRLKGINGREKVLKSEEKELETEKKKLLEDKEIVLSRKAEVEKIRAENEVQLSEIHKEKEGLRVTEEERSEYHRLQAELKEQIEKCRSQQEVLIKEAEDLKTQRESFEKEWEELDERKAKIENELKNITDQKEKLERDSHLEEERLIKEKQAAYENMQRELEALEVAKASFAETMEHERSMLSNKAESDRSQLLHEIEMRKRKLESDMQTKLEERERELQAKEKLFEEEKEHKLNNINYLRDVARREMADMQNERDRIEKEKLEVNASKNYLKEQQTEIRKDVDDLVALTKKLKEQREQFISERSRFLSSMESNRNCNPCGELLSELVLPEIDNVEMPNMSKLANILDNEAPRQEEIRDISPTAAGLGLPVAGGTVSWFRKCTSKILKLSPIKMVEPSVTWNLADQEPQPTDQANLNSGPSTTPHAAANYSFDVEKSESETGTKEVEVTNVNSDGDQSNINSKAQEAAADSLSNQNVEGQSRMRGKAKARTRRTRSVKDVVGEAKAIYGESINLSEPNDSTDNVDDSAKEIDGSTGEPGRADKATSMNGRKRGRVGSLRTCTTEQDGNESDGKSDSVTGGAHQRKRRQKVVSEQQGEVMGQRYNLRRPRRVTGETTLSKKNEETSGVQQDEVVYFAQTTATASLDVAVSDNGVSTNVVQHEATADSQDTDAGSPKRTCESEAMSEEDVNKTPQRVDSDGEDDESDAEHPGKVSIGKKLWTFLTT
ncbi:PREDICTED: protein CROWDED NUCLEI 1-like [Camelina sativa]|uniref:Protein CROWDED NUCLEI 1-like n=1 Tax=Camelina sativa TaxID=90675 RepID=A0ABM0Z7U4_CAMSA|nr:PREDICTED: protein CROWDED NUCLEI 1-like [Camelina sativa]